MVASLLLASFFAAAVPDAVAMKAASLAGVPDARVVTADEERRITSQAVTDAIVRCETNFAPIHGHGGEYECVVSAGDGTEWNATSVRIRDDGSMSTAGNAWWLPEARLLAPVRVGGDVKAPVVVDHVAPTYPVEARQARISGIVITEAVIDRSGRVVMVRVLKPLPFGLSAAAVDAIKQWTFRPGTLNNEPVDVIFNLTTNFRLDSPPDGHQR